MRTKNKELFKNAFKFALFILPIGLITGYITGMYAFETMGEAINELLSEMGMTPTMYMILGTIQIGLLYGAVLGFSGYIFAEKTNLLKPFRLQKTKTLIAIVSGAFLGLFLMGDYFIFAKLIPQVADTYVKGTVTPLTISTAVLYGGIFEEIMIRLFLMSLVSLVLWKIFAQKTKKENIPTWVYVTANVISAVVFAAGHLPATLTLFGSLTPLILFRCFLLNGIAGLVFGRLYRKSGIQYAMIAHIGTHITLNLLKILIIA